MIDLHDAVRAVYSNAVTIAGDEVDSLIVHDASGQNVTIVASTITAKLAEMQAAEVAAQQAAVAAKASAQAKLAALGLTPAEVTAIIGN